MRSEHMTTATTSTALFADGCFWCVEHDMEAVQGVIDVVSGYAGGTSESPTYENYAEGGHREVVEVTYDPSKVTYANLVEHILKHGDPTDADGSFYDRGPQYTPAIFYDTDDEKVEAEAIIKAADALKVFPKPITITVSPRPRFWPAEEYHQDYAKKNPLRYMYYRAASGRDSFIKKYWGESADSFTISSSISAPKTTAFNAHSWNGYVKPSAKELKARLTPLQYEVAEEGATEPPFKNAYDENHEKGVYVDVVSGEPLFLSTDKYESGTGWPSFVKPITPDAVTLHEDDTLFTARTEVRSAHANSHLGHVFDDGPMDRGGKRYCMNSAALRFIAYDDLDREGYGYTKSYFD
ncbi:MAG TPA: peptide-methionine (R)-S-oxide reductase MsrB [Candidatus Paceibacterota bacterium]|nr:peptide-methionine (R)-S-oxide reductase MsrB [Candidatus Paceibacterota bacterium]